MSARSARRRPLPHAIRASGGYPFCDRSKARQTSTHLLKRSTTLGPCSAQYSTLSIVLVGPAVGRAAFVFSSSNASASRLTGPYGITLANAACAVGETAYASIFIASALFGAPLGMAHASLTSNDWLKWKSTGAPAAFGSWTRPFQIAPASISPSSKSCAPCAPLFHDT